MPRLGEIYPDGEAIVRQGERGETMYIIQEGRAEVLIEKDGDEHRINVLGPGDFFGEMSILEPMTRSATVRTIGEARVLAVDKTTFLDRVESDPGLALKLLKTLSRRIRLLDKENTELRSRIGASEPKETHP